MRKVFGDYLIKFRDTTTTITNNTENTKAVVFLEDERSFWAKPLLNNFATYLNTGWNYYWFCTQKNYDFMVNLTREMGWNITVKMIQEVIPDIPHQMSGDTFNRVYKDPRWWSFFTEETILSAQLDTVLLREFDEKWLQYDMIGAPCNWNTMNGGLTLRKKSKMLECLNLPNFMDVRFSPAAEDVYFTSCLRYLEEKGQAKLPTREEATGFSIENFPVNVSEFSGQPFGLHGTNHYYMDDNTVSTLLGGGNIVVHKKPRIMIATPVYKWPPHPKFVESLKKCEEDSRFDMEFRCVQGDAHIERARSMLLLQYLSCDKPLDWYVMIDSDIEFNADIIWGIISRGKDVIGAGYAFKAPEGNPKYQQPVIRGLEGEVPTPEGLVKVRHLGGGFTVVSDQYLRKMCQEYSDLKFEMNPDLMEGKTGVSTYGLWNPVIIDQPAWGEGQREMLSEDYSFCERVIMMGGECWWDLSAVIAHWDGDKFYQLRTTNDTVAANTTTDTITAT
jgi:hypothetical protein